MKTGTLNFYCRYLTIKNLVVTVSDTRSMELKTAKHLSLEARHRS